MDRERARRVAARQGGRITWAQMCACGLTEESIRSWVRQGELRRTRARVYAFGYVRTDIVARTWEAILYAGPGACLTAGSGAYESGLISYRPSGDVVVASAHKRISAPGISVLGRRDYARLILPSGLPVAPLPDLMLDLAASMNVNVVRHALAQLDYRDELDLGCLHLACRRGRCGSRQLRRALEGHLPQLRRCKSPLEIDFLLLCEAHHLPLPLVNHRVNGIEVDMYWPQLRLIVELDGGANHHSAAQRRRDVARDAHQRAHGLTVIRLEAADVHRHRASTLARLADHGVQRAF